MGIPGLLSSIARKWVWVICLVMGGFPLMAAEKWAAVDPHVLPVTVQVGAARWRTPVHAVLPVKLVIADGWKLHGPAGSGDTLVRPPEMTCADANLVSLTVRWPQPTVWREEGQQSHVYTGTVECLVDIHLRTGEKTQLKVLFAGLACSSLCRPVSHEFPLVLSPTVSATVKPSLWHMLWYAFFGGCILNVMPCVFPVMGLKLSALVTAPAALLRRICGATILGILCSFWFLALMVVVLQKVMKQEIGWGVQFQNPYFVSCMSTLLILLAHTFFGGLSLSTPQWVQRLAPRGGGATVYAFLSGVLAVFLATPCSAPFLGAAMGFALVGTTLEIVCIFTAVAVGFAVPYFLSLFVPLGKVLPKPGPWTGYVAVGTGLLFIATALWLMGVVLAAFLSPASNKIVGVLAGLLMLVPLFFRKEGGGWRLWKSLFLILCSVGLALSPLWEKFVEAPSSPAKVYRVPMTTGRILWTPWSEDNMQKALQDGRIVFIDATAVACLSCEMNKRRVILSKIIQDLLTSPDILCMRADFTMGSPEILQLLKKYGRAGIPFNMVISKDYLDGIVLSEILTVKEVQEAVEFFREKALTRSRAPSYNDGMDH